MLVIGAMLVLQNCLECSALMNDPPTENNFNHMSAKLNHSVTYEGANNRMPVGK